MPELGSCFLKYTKGLLGISIFFLLTYLLSENKKSIKIKNMLIGIIFQVILISLVIKSPIFIKLFYCINKGFLALEKYTLKSLEPLLGNMAYPNSNSGFMLALHAFPIVITVSTLSSVLYYVRMLPILINTIAIFFEKLFKISKELGFGVVANLFVGQSETPLLIKPFLNNLSRSELFSLMSCGSAAMSVGVIAILNNILKISFPDILNYLLSAVIINVPITLLISNIIIPRETQYIKKDPFNYKEKSSNNILEAIYQGIMDGANVYIKIILMIFGFMFLLNLLNAIIAWGNPTAYQITVQRILGLFFYPFTWLMGIQLQEMSYASSVLGTKFAFNEVIAFQEFITIDSFLSSRTKRIIIFAIANFGNIGSTGILIGVYSSLLSKRKQEIINLSFKAIIAANLAAMINATLVGMFY